jgi:hypothetical protein
MARRGLHIRISERQCAFRGAMHCACTLALLTGMLAVPIVTEGQVLVAADAGGGLLSATLETPPGSVLQLAVAFPLASSIEHWPLEVSFGRSSGNPPLAP